MLVQLLLGAAIAFVASYLITPRFIAFLASVKMMDIDVQKASRPRLPRSGGLPVLFGILAGMMCFLFFNTFYFHAAIDITLIFAAVIAILVGVLIGLLDDMSIRAELVKEEARVSGFDVGLKQWQKPLLTFAIAVPLMAVQAGVSEVTLPFLGVVQLGIVYSLLLVPVTVVCVTNACNMLAGMNGLEAGMGAVALAAVGTYAYIRGSTEAAVIGLVAAAALVAFLRFNYYPAKIIQGDSLTYLIGAAFISATIIGNIERFAIIVFIPWMIEAFLKLRGSFRVSSLGTLQKDGTLKPKHDRILSLTHLAMRFRLKEYQITNVFILFELICVALAFALYL